jgi:hypothetical protein
MIHRPQSTLILHAESSSDLEQSALSRRTLMASSIGFLGLIAAIPSAVADDTGVTQAADGDGVTVYKLPSGLKYIELEPGREVAPTPRYGQVCIFSYKAYLKLPTDKGKQQFDEGGSFITKHGNGRMIAGLDEGLHTMRPGGLRRIIIPPKLGFVQPGLGPLPKYPWDRYKLNNLLEQMVEQRGGNLVYDVRLERVFDDEADQGYYDDAELSPEELEAIQNKLVKGRASRQGQDA